MYQEIEASSIRPGADPASDSEGASLWIFFALGRLSYPGVLHAQLMIGGFLFAFALEERSWPLRITTALVVVAALTRATAYLFPSYIPHLGYAATCWIAAILVWCSKFLPIVIRNAAAPRLD